MYELLGLCGACAAGAPRSQNSPAKNSPEEWTTSRHDGLGPDRSRRAGVLATGSADRRGDGDAATATFPALAAGSTSPTSLTPRDATTFVAGGCDYAVSFSVHGFRSRENGAETRHSWRTFPAGDDGDDSRWKERRRRRAAAVKGDARSAAPAGPPQGPRKARRPSAGRGRGGVHRPNSTSRRSRGSRTS